METAERKENAPANVLITGAAGQIAYSLIFMVLNGNMLGKNRKINLRLLDIPPMVEALNGVAMEIHDCAFPLLNELVATTDYREAFTGVEFALLVGARPRGPGMERKDLLKANAEIFKGQGEALNQYAHRNCKVVVVGNPANTNALIAQHFAPSLPRENFTALTRLDHNRAKAQIALRVRTAVEDIHNVIIWGNHSSTQYPDVNHAHIANGLHKTPVRQAVNSNEWLNGEFITTVQQRGAAIIKARKLSSAASAANAIVDHMRDWILGTADGEIVSMAVPSDGSYGIPEGVIYSYPVTCRDGTYTIVQGLNIDDFSREKMQATYEELLQEKTLAFE